VSGVLTQRYHRWHIGIDLGVPLNTPVVASHSGTVTFAGWSDIGYGYLVIVQSGSFITYYAHQTSLNVVAGQSVARWSVLGWSGSTGNSSGPHVHYETRINDVPVDPLTFEQRGYGTC
jgi:murein DD-endopeptidase MepM/ murein hydrolase activator NlpD